MHTVPYLRCSSISGVTWPMMKLFIQLEEAVICQLQIRLMYEYFQALTAQGNTIRTLRQRPNLSNDDPSTGTPAVAKVDHE